MATVEEAEKEAYDEDDKIMIDQTKD